MFYWIIIAVLIAYTIFMIIRAVHRAGKGRDVADFLGISILLMVFVSALSFALLGTFSSNPNKYPVASTTPMISIPGHPGKYVIESFDSNGDPEYNVVVQDHGGVQFQNYTEGQAFIYLTSGKPVIKDIQPYALYPMLWPWPQSDSTEGYSNIHVPASGILVGVTPAELSSK